jgi:hypothetical protein
MFSTRSGKIEASDTNSGAAISAEGQRTQMVSRGLGLEPEAGDRKTRKIYHKQ